MKLLNFPIGSSDFESVRQSGAEYIDKSELIADILNNAVQVLLFPRPRRFGKTLNLSMLRYFFDIRKDARALFAGLRIASLPAWSHLNQYPVIFVSFKEIKFNTLNEVVRGFQDCFAELYRRQDYLLEEAHLSPENRDYMRKVAQGNASWDDLKTALSRLMEILAKHHQRQVVVLIDEYDTPVHSAYTAGFYEEMVSFMRVLMGSAFKDNSHLFKGIITGILRVSKEGMFSGLNNIDVYSIMSDHYARHFGFTQEEVDGLLEKTGQPGNRELIRDWYNGFIVGNCQIYNPWSIINYFSKGGEPSPYWVGTSDNALVKQILAQGSAQLKQDFEVLVSGGEVVRTIDEFITLPELFKNEEIAFSLLLFSGYLKVIQKEKIKTDYRCVLKIPNREVQALFEKFLESFFDRNHFSSHQYSALLQSLVTGDLEVFEELLQDYLEGCFSYFDTTGKEPERFYHGFVLGLLVSLQETHWVHSNKESGHGRYDVMIVPKDPKKFNGLATIIEFKSVRKAEDLDKSIDAALAQIESKGYRNTLQAQGFVRIQTLAIVFCGKRLKMVVKTPEQ